MYYNSATGEIRYNGVPLFTQSEDSSEYNYYKEAYEFTTWYNSVVTRYFSDYEDTLAISNANSPQKGATSAFNDEKTNVIQSIITDNLLQAMDVYSSNSKIDFEMPELTGEDWDTILNNICVITFLQGLPVGTASFNDYVIMASTENEQYVDENSLYFVAYEWQDVYNAETGQTEQKLVSDGTYHRIGCSELTDSHTDLIIGYNRTEFELQSSTNSSGNTTYSYNQTETACYNCVVQASDASIESVDNLDNLDKYKKELRYQAYYKALAREKYNLVKLSDYVNGSTTQYE